MPDAQWKKQWHVASHTDTTKTYTVSMREDGTMACDCPRWKFHKAPKVDCKHCIGIRQQESPDQLIPPTPKELAVMKAAVKKQPEMAHMLVIDTGRTVYLED